MIVNDSEELKRELQLKTSSNESIKNRQKSTLQGTNISHLGKRKIIIFKMLFLVGYVNPLEGSFLYRLGNGGLCFHFSA